jgi:hypothetical protein
MSNLYHFPRATSGLALLAVENAYAEEGDLMGFGLALLVSCGIWVLGFGVAALMGS